MIVIMNKNTLSTAIKQQLNKEAKWSFALTLLYLIGWILSAYFSPSGYGVFGLPLWFEMSCFYLPVMFVLVSTLILKGVYQDIDFEDYEPKDDLAMNTHLATDKSVPTDKDKS